MSTKRRYSIFVREFGSQIETELLQVDRYPKRFVRALERKTCSGERSGEARYASVRLVCNEREQPV